jgi:hypothetical protein
MMMMMMMMMTTTTTTTTTTTATIICLSSVLTVLEAAYQLTLGRDGGSPSPFHPYTLAGQIVFEYFHTLTLLLFYYTIYTCLSVNICLTFYTDPY